VTIVVDEGRFWVVVGTTSCEIPDDAEPANCLMENLPERATILRFGDAESERTIR